MRAWVLEDLVGFYTRSAVSRTVKTVRKLGGLAALQQAEFEQYVTEADLERALLEGVGSSSRATGPLPSPDRGSSI